MWTHHGCTSACVHGDGDDRLAAGTISTRASGGANCRGSCGVGRDFTAAARGKRRARPLGSHSLGPEIIVHRVLPGQIDRRAFSRRCLKREEQKEKWGQS